MNDDQLIYIRQFLKAALSNLDMATQNIQAADNVAAVMDPGNLPAPFTLPTRSRGIDVSHYQSSIDWHKVKDAGIAFAFIKASEGIGFIDSQFKSNWANSKEAGLPRGAYHFYRFAFDPIRQADFFVTQMGQDFGELPPVVDVEEDIKPVVLSSSIKLFCDRVFQSTNKRCLIYTGAWWWSQIRIGTDPQEWVKDYPLWLAAYVSEQAVSKYVPRDWQTWSFWQYANNGRVNGINGNVDLDVSA